MAVQIDGVTKGGYAELLGIRPGGKLVSINGHEITDGLDYRFYETNSAVELIVQNSGGKLQTFKIKKGQYEPLGFEFETYLIDKERSCRNKCVFCFIDQLPKGMRETMYFKDDDTRLSFLFGNYITLTNIDEKEIRRIIDMRISPVNISVHTMNPELRCRMMNNRFAGESLKFIKMLVEGGIKINCQLVMCPGINDGNELVYSLKELSRLGENVQSVACVPVGLTKYREGLEKLEPFNADSAADVIHILEEFGDRCLKERGTRVFYPSDEFYLIAGKTLPEYEFYEDFPQIENGVGMFRDLEEGFTAALEDIGESAEKRHVSSVTGTAIYPLLNDLLDELRRKCNNLTIDLYPVENHFFGGAVDVTGLITGGDIIAQLKGKVNSPILIIPSVMLKADEDVFLDGVTLEDIAAELNVRVVKAGNTGADLVNAMLRA